MTDILPPYDGIDSSGTVVSERELFDLMWQAASRATEECVSRGISRGDKITKDSARAAADEVYRQYRPQDFVAPVVPLPPVPDEVRERMERERLI
jgi:hypothetical protein